MEKNYIYRVLERFFNDSFPPATTRKVQEWLTDKRWTAEKDRALQTIWDGVQASPDASTYQSLERVKTTIRLLESKKRTRIWIKCAAVMIPVLLLLGGYFSMNREVKMLTVFTSNKEQKECTLPDGTTIRLNSGSKITYPSKFKDTTRIVTLEGEAYFAVTGNPKQPFIVKTGSLSVKVLGTKFNISAYPGNDKAVATLNSGSIQVDTREGEGDSRYILIPNQQIIYNKTDRSVLVNTVTEETVGWKDGLLIFQDATFNDIMNTLQRRFDVSIEYDKQIFPNVTCTVKFVHHESLTEILNVLQDVIRDFDYTIQNKKVTLIKK